MLHGIGKRRRLCCTLEVIFLDVALYPEEEDNELY